MPLAQPFAQHLAQPLAQPLDGGASQFDPLLRHIIRTVGARRVVLVTALPGTQACVATRAALTSQLIADFGFAGVVVATPTAEVRPKFEVISNWFEELERIAPTEGK